MTSAAQLLSDGLNDDSELVQEACVNGLLRKWSLESNDGDFISLLARLDVESSSEVGGACCHGSGTNSTVIDVLELNLIHVDLVNAHYTVHM